MSKLTKEINTAISDLSDMQQIVLSSYKLIEESTSVDEEMILRATENVNNLYLCIENAHNVKGLSEGDYKESVKLCKEILDKLDEKKRLITRMVR